MKEQNTKDAFNDPSIKVPFFLPNITKEDRNEVNRAFQSYLLTDGPQLRKFEELFSKFTSSKYAIGVSNATAALHLSLRALGIGKGDEVIVPDLTFVATASAVLLTGATPVLADIEKDDLNISIQSIKKSITSRTKAILPVHLAGKACNIGKIRKIARSFDLAVVEDCAHAIGTKYEKRHVGTFSEAGCFSFYPTKNITTLEGGMVITNSQKIANYVKTTRNHGITKSLTQRYSKGKPWDYDVVEPGYNYRLDEVRASLGINQLKRIKKINFLRKEACKYYNSKLKTIPGIILPPLSEKNDNAYHLYIIRIQKKYKFSRDTLFKKLLKAGIRTSVHYKPLHEFTVMKKRSKIYDKLTDTKAVYREIISLPLYHTITRKEIDFVVQQIQK